MNEKEKKLRNEIRDLKIEIKRIRKIHRKDIDMYRRMVSKLWYKVFGSKSRSGIMEKLEKRTKIFLMI